MEVSTVRDREPALELGNNWELKEVTINVALDDGGTQKPVLLKTYRLEKKSR